MVAVAAGLRARHWRHVMTARVHKHHILGRKVFAQKPRKRVTLLSPLG